MFAGLLLVVPLLLLLAVGTVVLVVLAATRRPDARLTSEVAAARRHGLVTSVLAIVFVVLAPAVLWPMLSQVVPEGFLLGVLPLLGAIGAQLVLLVGEKTWPRPRGTTRTALVHPRSVGMFLRGGWAVLTATSVATLAVVIATGRYLGRNDDGHSLHTVDYAPDGSMTERMASPFPGWDYGLPQTVALLVLLALLGLVLRAVTGRPAVVTADAETDLLLRRASAARTYRVVSFAVLLTMAGDLFFAGTSMQRIYTDGGDVAGKLAVLVALAAGLGALAVLLVPAPRLPREVATPSGVPVAP
jgi:hypothetical protein